MHDTAILEVAIGLAFVYLLLSLLVSALFEVVSSAGRLRHKELWRGIQLLLGAGSRDHAFARAFMEHPLIKAVCSPSNLVETAPDGARVTAPSSLSRELFATALLDSLGVRPALFGAQDEVRRVVSTYPVTGTANDLAEKVRGALSAAQPNLPGSALGAAIQDRLARVNEATAVASLQEELLAVVGRSSGAALQALLDAAPVPAQGVASAAPPAPLRLALACLARESNGDLAAFKVRVGTWFDEGMSRSGGWYRRRALYHTLFLAALVTLAMNVDSLAIVQKLSSDSALRRSLVAQAEAFAESDRGRELAARTRPETAPIAPGSQAPGAAESMVFEPNPVRAGSSAVGRIVRASKASSDIPYQLKVQETNSGVTLSVDQVVIPMGSTEAGFLVKVPTNSQGHAVSIAVTNGPALFGVLQVLPDPVSEAGALKHQIESLGLPLGWSTPPEMGWDLVAKLLGLSATIIAVSLGAPVWFDVMTKLLKLRAPSSAPASEGGAPVAPVVKPS